MNVNRLLFFGFTLFFCFALEAKSFEPYEYYGFSRLGIVDAGLYSGPWAPELAPLNKRNEPAFALEKEMDVFFQRHVSEELSELSSFLSEEIFGGLECNSELLNKNSSYMRYLFRLQTMSYLFAGLQELSFLSQNLHLDKNTCTIDWNKVLKQCHPQTPDMNLFLKRAPIVIAREIQNMEKQAREIFKFELWNEEGKRTWPLSYNRLSFVKGSEALFYHASDIKKAIAQACSEDLDLFSYICSEEDSLYGVSYVPLAYQVITRSHVMRVIDEGGKGRNCLKRFVDLVSSRERLYRQLPTIYDSCYKLFSQKKDAMYLQGDLFLPGALKEFDIKGLDDFIYAENKPKVQPTATPQVVLAQQTPVAFEPTPTPTVTATPTPTAIPTPLPTVAVVRSAFEEACYQFANRSPNVDFVDVDMEALRGDLVFTDELMKKAEGLWGPYQKVEALQEMKQFDKLGSEQAPVPLRFLLFLINLEQHQGLYNVLSVIGEGFYVVNDLERKRKAVYIKLLNEESSNWQWQLRLTEAPPILPEVKTEKKEEDKGKKTKKKGK